MTKNTLSPEQEQQLRKAGIDAYDSLMQWIEPDLTNANLLLLDEKYKSETEADWSTRMERYAKAFETYDQRFEQYAQELTVAMQTARKEAREDAEWQSKTDEAKIEEDIQEKIVSI